MKNHKDVVPQVKPQRLIITNSSGTKIYTEDTGEGVAPQPQLPDLPTLDLARLEAIAIMKALEKTNYVQRDAAKLLGITPRVLNYKIAKAGIRHDLWRVNK